MTADVVRTLITANEVMAGLGAGEIQKIMQDYHRVSYSLEGEQKEQGEAVSNLVPLFGSALFVIYALLAIPLKSFSKPLIIMSVIPFALVGAIWGHLIMKNAGYVSGLAMMSILGFIAASGVVVNSSLVLVHRIGNLFEGGDSAESVNDATSENNDPSLEPIVSKRPIEV